MKQEKTLTAEQVRNLVALIGERELLELIYGSCPGNYFGDACAPDSCPMTEDDKKKDNFCSDCIRQEIAKFKS